MIDNQLLPPNSSRAVPQKLRDLALKDPTVAYALNMYETGQVGYINMLERLALVLAQEKKSRSDMLVNQSNLSLSGPTLIPGPTITTEENS